MTGYFRQLAERTLAPMPALHPLGGAPAARPQPMAFEDDPAPMRPAPDVPALATDRVADGALRTTPRNESMQRPASVATVAVAPLVASGSDVTRHITVPAQIEDTVAPAQHAIASLPEAVRESSSPTASAGRQPFTQTAAPAPPAMPMRANLPLLPQHLQPEATKAKAIPTRSRRRSESRDTTTVPDTAPEVHIHIGRIELTAIAPSNPVRRESTPGRKPMSLDEYLQHRRKAP